jgi:hypothetical protein
MEFRASIQDGKIEWASTVVAAAFQEFKKTHEGAHIVITEEKPTRSHSQNAYYWANANASIKSTTSSWSDSKSSPITAATENPFAAAAGKTDFNSCVSTTSMATAKRR